MKQELMRSASAMGRAERIGLAPWDGYHVAGGDPEAKPEKQRKIESRSTDSKQRFFVPGDLLMLLRYPGLVLYVALVSPLTAQEPPPYPYALPDWYEQTDRKLKSIRVSLDFVDVPLKDCLSHIKNTLHSRRRTFLLPKCRCQ